MNKLIFRAAAAVASLLCLLLTSCNHRELCYDHEHWIDLQVAFDWSEEPAAAPATMVVWFFPADAETEGGPRSYEFGGNRGGTIRIPAGKYRAVCFNGGTETLLERGSAFDNLHLTTESQSLLEPMHRSLANAPRPEPGKDQDVKGSPETLWSSTLDVMEFLPATAGQKVTFTPTQSTTSVHVVITGVENLTSDIALSAAITGVSESWLVSAQRGHGKDVTMPVAISATGDDTIEGEFNIFGHCHASELTHILTIYTSNKYYFNFDVTDVMHESPSSRSIEIRLHGLRLPHPDGTGMSPSITDWGDGERIHIDML